MSERERIPLADFIKTHGLRLTYAQVATRPDGLGEWKQGNPTHWRCTLHAGELGVNYGSMRVYFSKGEGHKGEPPTVAEVLSCLADDAASVESAGGKFEEWASELGYSSDSREAERIFRACERQRDALRRLLGLLGD